MDPLPPILGTMILPRHITDRAAAWSPLYETDPGKEPLPCLKLTDRCLIFIKTTHPDDDPEKWLKPTFFTELQITLLVTCATGAEPAFYRTVPTGKNKSWYGLTMILNKEEDRAITVFLPDIFFKKYFAHDPAKGKDIHSHLTSYFCRPLLFTAPLKLMTEQLPFNDLHKLFLNLFMKSKITEYQLILMAQHIPEAKSLFINILSRNGKKDIRVLINRYRNHLTRRDEGEAVFCVQEALRNYLLKEKQPGKTNHLAQFIHSVKTLQPLLVRDFPQWIEIIKKKKTFGKTARLTDNQSLALLGRNTQFLTLLKNNLSAGRYAEIIDEQSLAGKTMDMNKARARFVTAHVETMVQQTQTGSFDLLMAMIDRTQDYSTILEATGWKKLSTAMKETPGHLQKKILGALPQNGKNLIEDILKGTVNPDILHDNRGINRARNFCSQQILMLEFTGLIELNL